LLSSLVSLALFVGFPALVLWWRRVSLRTGFQLELPKILAVLGGGLLGLSLWPWVYELELLTLSPERLEFLKKLFESIRADLESVPVGARLAALAVVPAVGEELFFRGVIVGGLKGRMSQGAVLAISALAFGLFHVLVRDTLLFERLLPSTALGLVLGWVCLKTGSVLPGMILHITHNGLLILIDYYKERLTGWGIGLEERTHLPWEWLAGSAAIVVVATGIIALTQASQTSQTTGSAVREGAGLKGSASSAD
jgi:membrane protease YdiL (CAAX protease family)